MRPAACGVLWVSDEYGPIILKIDPATGMVLKNTSLAPARRICLQCWLSGAPTVAWKAWRWTLAMAG